MSIAAPRAAIIMPSVAIKAGNRPLVESIPFTNPHSSPVNAPNAIPTGMGRPQVLIDRIRREFVLGGHKAAAVAGLLDRADVYLVSEFPDDVVRRMCMTPFSSVDEAVAAALARAGDAARCLVVPHGSRVTAAA